MVLPLMVAVVFSERTERKFAAATRRDIGFSAATATLNRSHHETLPRFKMIMGIARFASMSAPLSVLGNHRPMTTLTLL